MLSLFFVLLGLLADGGLLVVAGHVVPPDTVVVDVVEDCQTLSNSLGLGTGPERERETRI